MTRVADDPSVPPYLLGDLKRMMVRIAANEHWYEQQWLGAPIWQLPDDLLRLQQIVSEVRPRWIIETGTKFGGSAIFFASLLRLLGCAGGDNGGGVITLDIHGTVEAQRILTEHPQADLVKPAILGDAADPTVAAQAKALLDGRGPVLVFLDDNHNAEHVLREMTLYGPLVTPGSYLIVADTVFGDLAGTPVGTPTAKYPDVAASNPRVAVERFLAEHPEFERDLRFLESGIGNFLDGFLRRVSLS
ncbi:MAG: cephalosporin hydroxylase family protein [Chromatiaceae bacterium]|nr:cephalosporin hydroxylase family protein [Chromatiaceae bacterium]MCF7995296.1 cephalosporin hydroxylase family protein [Chromatiaceae bacterium]MCF8016510.1 cephalosporin hydroxylase family protein [Chromatiaceae bacterium]